MEGVTTTDLDILFTSKDVSSCCQEACAQGGWVGNHFDPQDTQTCIYETLKDVSHCCLGAGAQSGWVGPAALYADDDLILKKVTLCS